MWPYPLTHLGTPSHLGDLDLVAATLPSQAPAGAAQKAPELGQWEGQDVPLVRSSSCIAKGGILNSRRYLPTYLVCGCTVHTGCSGQVPAAAVFSGLGMFTLPASDAVHMAHRKA